MTSKRTSRKPTGKDNRKIATKNILPKILIICEGETEEKYFQNLVSFLNLSFITVKTKKSVHPTPCSAANTAMNEQDKEIANKGKNNKYENLFCVVDEDKHDHASADKEIATYNSSHDTHITKVYTNPCFEFWLLLHIKYSTKPYIATPTKSIGDFCLEDLQKSDPTLVGYDKSKNISDFFEFFNKKLSTAITHAKKLSNAAKTSNNYNPYTMVWSLIEYIKGVDEQIINIDKKLKF
jgi:hypothetical protein